MESAGHVHRRQVRHLIRYAVLTVVGVGLASAIVAASTIRSHFSAHIATQAVTAPLQSISEPMGTVLFGAALVGLAAWIKRGRA